MIFKMLRLVVCICLGLFIFSGNSFSEESPTENEKNWQFSLAPFYLWAINIDGDMKFGPISAPVDVPFSDVFDNLEGAFIVHFEAIHKNRWGLLVDVNYLDLENDMTLPAGISLNVDLDMAVAQVDGFYRMQREAHSFDLFVGLRYTEIANTITVIGGPTLVDGSQDWLDPLVGGRWIWNFADDWSLFARGDIGGFGVGSDFAWQAVGLIEWQPFKYASFLAGYRALDMDYEDGSGRDYFNFDGTIHGPVIGVNFKW